jgi:mannose-1-phosphate guanylyltransferase
MKALLLAAGYGERLRPLTNNIPKCLVEIQGRPLLDYWLETLEKGGIKEVLINLHYLSDKVKKFIKNNNHNLNITLIQEERLLGTAGTISKNYKYFQNDPALVIHADNLSIFSMSKFIKSFNERKKNIQITMMTFETTTPKSCGILKLDDSGVIKEIYEKVSEPPGNLANAAVYIFSNDVIKFINKLDKSQNDISNDILPLYIGKINTYHNKIYHRDIGTIESLKLAQEEFPTVYRRYNKL